MLILSIKSLMARSFKHFYTYLCHVIVSLMKHLLHITAVVVLGAAVACADSSRNRVQSAPQPVADLASAMRDYAAASDSLRLAIASDYGAELKAFVKTISEDSLSDVLLQAWSSSAPVAVFTPAVDSVFPTLRPVEEALGYTLSAARAAGLSLPERRYAAVVYGRPESILFVDSVMLIAMNHYLGADYEGYSHWPLYRRLAKTPGALPYDMAEALIATSYPYEAPEADNTLLANMLYQGALAYAKMQTVDGATVAGALGYDDATLKTLDDSQKDMWRELVARRLLYDTSARTVERFIMPVPMLRIDGLEWPARAGRYIGYRIVEAYVRETPEASLSFLLSPAFYLSPDVLAKARYMQ